MLVSFRQSPKHKDFIESGEANVTTIQCPVTILMRPSTGSWWSNVQFGSHKGSPITIDL
jgi:hypothetical protein